MGLIGHRVWRSPNRMDLLKIGTRVQDMGSREINWKIFCRPDIICGICSAQTLPAALGFLENVNEWLSLWQLGGFQSAFSFPLSIFFYSRMEGGEVTSVECVRGGVCVSAHPTTHFAGGHAVKAGSHGIKAQCNHLQQCKVVGAELAFHKPQRISLLGIHLGHCCASKQPWLILGSSPPSVWAIRVPMAPEESNQG